MYLKRLKITNIRSITEFEIKFEPKVSGGWHVILGDNGSGKSSVIRSIALAMVGPDDARASRQIWSNWLQSDKNKATIEAVIHHDRKADYWSGQGPIADKDIILQIEMDRKFDYRDQDVGLIESKKGYGWRTIWGTGSGWFSASFGPFRRFSGGDKEYDRLFVTNPRLAPHLSAFGEDVALTESIRWLQSLHIIELESARSSDSPEKKILNRIITFINNSKLLPHGAQIKGISSKELLIFDGNGNSVALEQMSDGYRSILSLTFELIRQMFKAYGAETVLRHMDNSSGIISLPGIVAIDEVDAHLHPAWQRNIGEWFTHRFPKVQFIVTTHSPLVCRAAANGGSIWRLPVPGTESSPMRVEGQEFERLVYGDLLDAYSTDFFGKDVTRSIQSQELLDELAKLNLKSVKGKILKDENERLERLRSMLPSTSPVIPARNDVGNNAEAKK